MQVLRSCKKKLVSWVRCNLMTVLRAARCCLLFREPCWCAWHQGQQGQKTRSSCSLRSIGLSLRLLAWVRPAHWVGVRRLRPTCLSTKCNWESEALGNFWADSHNLVLLLWYLAGSKFVFVASLPNEELLKAIVMPLSCVQREGEVCKRQKELAWSRLFLHSHPKPWLPPQNV